MAFDALREHGEITAKDWSTVPPGHPLQGRVTLNLRPLPQKKHIKAWKDAVNASAWDDETKAILRKETVGNRLSGLAETEMKEVLEGLKTLVTNKLEKTTEYVASAQCLLSSSKLLSAFGRPERKALGLTEESFLSQPRYIITAGPPEPTGALLIENPQSFEQAVIAGISKDMVLISVYGYGLASTAKKDIESFWTESFGATKRSLIPLVRDGNPPSLQKIFRLKNIYWWGDLDLAGLDIYQSIKTNIPHLRLSALYGAMLNLLHAGKGHPYAKCVGKDQQLQRYKNRTWDEPEVQGLASACTQKAIDQEAVNTKTIRELASLEFKHNEIH